MSLTALLVAGFDSRFQRAPPRFVFPIPVDGGAQTRCEIGMLWPPTQFFAQLRRIDRAAQVVSDPVDNTVEIVGGPAHQLQHRQVVALPFGADQVGPTDLAAVQASTRRPPGARAQKCAPAVAWVKISTTSGGLLGLARRSVLCRTC
jgi:hypothetical protein